MTISYIHNEMKPFFHEQSTVSKLHRNHIDPGEMTAPARTASPRCSQRGQRGLDGWYIASYMILADRCLPKIDSTGEGWH